jgi:hypothetical protein
MKVAKWKNSLAVRLPVAVVHALELQKSAGHPRKKNSKSLSDVDGEVGEAMCQTLNCEFRLLNLDLASLSA